VDNTLLNVSRDCELLYKERCVTYLQVCPDNDKILNLTQSPDNDNYNLNLTQSPDNDNNLNLTQMIIVDNWASIDDNIGVKAFTSIYIGVKAGSSLFKLQLLTFFRITRDF